VKIDRAVLRTRVGRRIFGLFVICAIVPIAALAGLSFGLVSAQLEEQSQRRLHHAARIIGLAIYERLVFLDAEAERFLLRWKADPAAAAVASHEELTRRFIGLELVGRAGRRAVFGIPSGVTELTAAERDGVESGRAVVVTRIRPGEPAAVALARAAGPGPEPEILVAEVDTRYLWGSSDAVPLPALTELCVLDSAGQVLVCTLPLSAAALQRATRREVRSGAIPFEWSSPEADYLASTWQVFLPSRFASPAWTVVLSESKRDVLASLVYFRQVFPLVVVLSLCAVVLLSVRLIRRNLVPLDRLQEGTRQIAQRRFDSRVSVTSGDEFEELAGSFNRMAEQLGRQFHALGTMAEITQIVLSSLEARRVVETVIARLGDVCPCDRAAVILTEETTSFGSTMYLDDPSGVRRMLEAGVILRQADAEALVSGRVATVAQGPLPAYLAPLAERGVRACALFPVLAASRLAAVIVLGYHGAVTASPDDLAQARHLANQVAVALSNARLLHELEQLNWGTLLALARAIDAKSPWTAGHSERVTALALDIGRTLGMTEVELAVLHRGGLLHDIGKIGTPAEILDKPSRLSDEELRIMRQHAGVGASILEPITAYREVIPIVGQHHEWFDGNGYPAGLAGESISLGARIFSVADVYDALRSDRPYRVGQDREKVIAYIRERSGTQFDPRVVAAFLRVMEDAERAEGAKAPATPA
jgi:putative nucleotidyltransferase with HDIG domain